ncbi:hypothetical protein FHL15_010239 [Xylaria flabelliformis]|uniref:polynucleotide adenylyltransferase n=1 Tax=Xylaria flabelliformis TaxID=2512241 RepID=A0A553HLW1_9PEZI|nr:hypothetical protein FHL15_010239 [Xylaria flabelliformis]
MQSAGGPLEDRLRNLILTSSNPEAMSELESSTVSLPPGFQHSHHISPSDEGPRDEKHPSSVRPAPKGGKKRPNQAERRLMKAEFQIPVDSRAPTHPFSRQYTPPQNHSDPYSPHHSQQQKHSSSHTSVHPATFQNRPHGSHTHEQSRRGYGQPSASSSTHQSDWRHQQQPKVDGLFRGVNVVPADAFPARGGRNPIQPQYHALYTPAGHRQPGLGPEQLANQSAFLDQLCHQIISGAEIGPDEIAEKENFRMRVESICRNVVSCYEREKNGATSEFQPETVELKCFGSLASGFATKAADMDLGLLSPISGLSPDSPDSPIPRLIEGALLAAGFGARLLTKTRVPIIKLCEKPDKILRESLLDARKKWEDGVDQEEREPDEDVPEDTEIFLDNHSRVDTDSKQSPTKSQVSQLTSSVKIAPLHEDGLISLKQGSNQSLSSYYNNAKRLLRRLNGRDITHSNSQDFTEADFILLDKVASAFVQGLYDTSLKSRILAYPSFHIGDTARLTSYRSLFGVNMMIEGEKLVLSWELRQLPSRNPKTDQAYERVIQQWKDLQYNKNFGTNPVWFNKELQLAVESLRQIPSVQIMQLRQDQYESPVQYHGRTSKIAISLSKTPSSPNIDMRSLIVQHYVVGIRDEEIRNQVHDFVALTGTQALRTVARKHKSLHLAAEYGRAVEHGRYRPEDLPILHSYMAILRRKPIPSLQQPIDFEYLIPLMRNEVGILDNIRQLPDPATLSPNKPKDKFNDSLEFPKSGVGVQCDVNFSAHLALQNTLLLRCYSYTDPRVRPLVLFVKHWAKARGINTPYRGTLSSYGYVLMVLHYLVNVVEPFVCPNLQELAPPDPDLSPQALEGIATCQGHNVRFWRDERAIHTLAQQNQLNRNHDSLGTLLQGFFEYYAQGNMMATYPKKGFDWGRDVLSLRTHGGLLSKAEKGWTGAKTVVQPQSGTAAISTEVDATKAQSPSLKSQTPLLDSAATDQTPKSKDVKEVRHRFLFAIEDPFELDHNVARTVTHNGIVAIRDEFRRAWRIIKAAGKGHASEDLLEDVKAHMEEQGKRQFMSLLDEIHGNEVFTDPRIVM